MEAATQYFGKWFFLNRSQNFIALLIYYARHLGVKITGPYCSLRCPTRWETFPGDCNHDVHKMTHSAESERFGLYGCSILPPWRSPSIQVYCTELLTQKQPGQLGGGEGGASELTDAHICRTILFPGNIVYIHLNLPCPSSSLPMRQWRSNC